MSKINNKSISRPKHLYNKHKLKVLVVLAVTIGLTTSVIAKNTFFKSYALSDGGWAMVMSNLDCHLGSNGLPITLKSGDRGTCVRALQFSLAQAATPNSVSFGPPSFTGIFNSETKSYVVRLQKKLKLPVTGKVEANTWRVIKGCLSDGSKSWSCARI